MAVSTSVNKVTHYSPEWTVFRVAVTFDRSYPAGGELVDVSRYLAEVKAVWPETALSPGGFVVGIESMSGATYRATLRAATKQRGNVAPLAEIDEGTDVRDEEVVYYVAGRG